MSLNKRTSLADFINWMNTRMFLSQHQAGVNQLRHVFYNPYLLYKYKNDAILV